MTSSNSTSQEAKIVVDPGSRVKALIALTQELTSIFEAENDSLRARRPSDMAPLQADKARLAAAYAQSIRQIAHDRGLVDGAGDILLEQLKEITRNFEDRASEQRALLTGAQIASEGVLHAVADEVATTASAGVYGSSGETRRPADTSAITLNENA